MYKFLFLFLFISCEDSLPGFNFKNFKNTPLEKLSISVKEQDLLKIIQENQENKIDLDSCELKFGTNLLMTAVANNLDKSVEQLLVLGANPNKQSIALDSNFTCSPISIACTSYYKKNFSDVKILKLLIKYGANVNSKLFLYNKKNKIYFETPLMLASESGNLDVVKILIENGADFNMFEPNSGNCPVSNALIQENLDILEYLIIEKNAKIPPFCINGNDGSNITFFEIFNKLELEGFPNKIKAKRRIIEHLKKR